MVHDGKVNSGVFMDFCKRLLRDADAPVYLVVDGHPCRRCRATKEFVAATEGRLKLFFLPGYSQELNADEWVWKNVKHDRIAKTGVDNSDLVSRSYSLQFSSAGQSIPDSLRCCGVIGAGVSSVGRRRRQSRCQTWLRPTRFIRARGRRRLRGCRNVLSTPSAQPSAW